MVLSRKALAELDCAWIEDEALRRMAQDLMQRASRDASDPKFAEQALTELSALLTQLGWKHKGEVNYYSTGFVDQNGVELPSSRVLAHWATHTAGFEERYGIYQRSDGLSLHQAFRQAPVPIADLYRSC